MFTGGGRARFLYPGPTTTFEFANETELTIENYARPMINFRSVQSGEDIRDNFFYFGSNSDVEVANKLQVDEPVMQVAAAPLGHPPPVLADPYHVINAYYIDAPGYEDVAVLQVTNFVAEEELEIPFQKLTQQFIPAALKAGKTKVIIDVQANGGGTILQGYDMFKQFFPAIEPNARNRFRAFEDIDLIGKSFSSFASQFPREASVNQTVLRAQANYFDYHQDMKADGTPFTSWEEKYGPVEANGG